MVNLRGLGEYYQNGGCGGMLSVAMPGSCAVLLCLVFADLLQIPEAGLLRPVQKEAEEELE